MAKKVKSKFTEEEQIQILKEFESKSKLYDYRTKDYSLEVIRFKYNNATLYVPSYQRGFVWNNHKRSKFIESVFLGMPLTPFLVSEGKEGKLEIIDGSQRIRTLISFYKNEFSLKGLKKLKTLENANFKDLHKRLQNGLDNRDFRIIVVDNADEQVRKDIFERVNTTAEKLTDSEIRKGSYSGVFWNLVEELTENETYNLVCKLTDKSSLRGENEELVLRFLVYSEFYEESRGKVKDFLDEKLLEQNKAFEILGQENACNDKQQKAQQKINELKADFVNMVSFVEKHFPKGFHKKELGKGGVPRVRFEAISVGVHLALKEKPDLTNPDMDWINSRGFKKTTTSDASNNPNRLKDRIEFVRDGLLGRLDQTRLEYG